MYENILLIKSSYPLEITRDFNEPKHISYLFKGKGFVKMNTSGTMYLIYNLDSSLVAKSDSIFQKFRIDASVGTDYDKKKQIERITFERWYFERKGV